ncbi:hypothetical protein A0H81_10504 [Grifola frondosa]|uniref:Uncharacterized protein n=1 Tax=Grifola frondosa TaxID=5627 RepID=A0A1C7M4H2_GRIFR|nr:hypothetical protein A0H81_10504 [Grifola frondosa]
MAPSPAQGATREDGAARRFSQRTAPTTTDTATSKLDLFKKTRSKIDNLDKATAFLEKYQLIIPGEAPSHHALVTGLLHFASVLVDATLEKLAPTWKSLEATREDLEAQAISTHELVSQIQDTLAQTQDYHKAVSSGAANIATLAAMTPTVQHALPTTHASAIDREETRARQILIDGTGLVAEDGTRLSETILVAKAEAALRLMRGDDIEVPPTIKFTSATCLCNGGVIYEVTKAEDAICSEETTYKRRFLENFVRTSNNQIKGLQCDSGIPPDSF